MTRTRFCPGEQCEQRACAPPLRTHSLPTEQLTSVRRLLKKLQFMFELPSRMRRAIALDALAEAVQYATP